MKKILPLAITLVAFLGVGFEQSFAQAQQLSVRSEQATSTIEISPNHGHTIMLVNASARIVKAWPGAFDAFDFGEHPNIPNARIIYIKLKPSAKIDSTTLTLIISDGLGNETIQTFNLKRVSGTPKETTTLIGGSQPAFAQATEPVQPQSLFASTPPSNKAPTLNRPKSNRSRPKGLKVAQEFTNDVPPPAPKAKVKAVEVEKIEPKVPKKPVVPDSVQESENKAPKPSIKPKTLKSKPKNPKSEPSPEVFPLPQVALKLSGDQPKLDSAATPSSSATKTLIPREDLDRYSLGFRLKDGLHKAVARKEIGRYSSLYWNVQDAVSAIQSGSKFERAVKSYGVPMATAENLLKYAGVQP